MKINFGAPPWNTGVIDQREPMSSFILSLFPCKKGDKLLVDQADLSGPLVNQLFLILMIIFCLVRVKGSSQNKIHDVIASFSVFKSPSHSLKISASLRTQYFNLFNYASVQQHWNILIYIWYWQLGYLYDLLSFVAVLNFYQIVMFIGIQYHPHCLTNFTGWTSLNVDNCLKMLQLEVFFMTMY